MYRPLFSKTWHLDIQWWACVNNVCWWFSWGDHPFIRGQWKNLSPHPTPVNFTVFILAPDWSISLTAKESIHSVAVGDGWITIATNKQLLCLLSVGGVQREVISVPGRPVTLSGWGGWLAIVYQAGPCKLKICAHFFLIASFPGHIPVFLYTLIYRLPYAYHWCQNAPHRQRICHWN